MQKKIVGVILAAGKSSRMWPLSFNHRHKSHFFLGGKSLLEHTANELFKFVNEVIIVKSPEHVLEELFQDLNLLKKIKTVDQNNALSQGDAILQAYKQYDDYDKYFIVNAYHMFSDKAFSELASRYVDDFSYIVLTETNNCNCYGIAGVQDDRVLEIIEKPLPEKAPSNLRVLGTYLLAKDFFEKVFLQEENREDMLEVALDKYAKKYSYLKFIKMPKPFISLKYPWEYLMFSNKFLEQIQKKKSPSASIDERAILDEANGPIFIDEGVKIMAHAIIKGPVYLGKNVVVGNFSLVRECVIEEGSLIGSYCEVARSLVQKNCQLHQNYVGDSILGEGVKMGAGFITANKRLDRKNIRVSVKNQIIETGLRGLGAIVGEGVAFGINSSTMPGTLIGANSSIYPLVAVNGVVEENSRIKDNFFQKDENHNN